MHTDYAYRTPADILEGVATRTDLLITAARDHSLDPDPDAYDLAEEVEAFADFVFTFEDHPPRDAADHAAMAGDMEERCNDYETRMAVVVAAEAARRTFAERATHPNGRRRYTVASDALDAARHARVAYTVEVDYTREISDREKVREYENAWRAANPNDANALDAALVAREDRAAAAIR